MAAVELFKQTEAKTVSTASCTAGLSLGEYTALVFAGVMSFKDALKVSQALLHSLSLSLARSPLSSIGSGPKAFTGG